MPIQHHRSVPFIILLIDPTKGTFTNMRVDTNRPLFFWCLDSFLGGPRFSLSMCLPFSLCPTMHVVVI